MWFASRLCLLAGAIALACGRTPTRSVTPRVAGPTEILQPMADHHMHLASVETVENLTPTPLPAAAAELPEELNRLLRRRESTTAASPAFVADLYTNDAVIRARRGGGWVAGAINIARALRDYAPGYRLVPVTYDVRGPTGYVAGYFARGDRYRATFQLGLRMEGGTWRIAVDNVIPVVRKDVLNDKIRAVLDRVSAALTTSELSGLNKRADVDKQDPDLLAVEWLKSKGFKTG